MKKLLLTAAVFAASVGAFAQAKNEVGVIDPVAAGIDSNYSSTVKAGMELALPHSLHLRSKNDNGDERMLLSGGKLTDGISTIRSGVVKKDNGRIYNIAGQRVDGAYKGIVIRGGEKFIQR